MAAILEKQNSLIINGGIINSYSHAKIGSSDWMVVEADESDDVSQSYHLQILL